MHKLSFTQKGTFHIVLPDQISNLYFPLANKSEVMESITPELSGDSKMGQNVFMMPPVSEEDSMKVMKVGGLIEGYEALGGLGFQEIILQLGKTTSYNTGWKTYRVLKLNLWN